MPVESQRFDDEAVEVAGQEISQVKRAWLGLGELGETLAAGEEFVAMRAFQALGAFLRKHPVDAAGGAAIGVGDEDLSVGVPMPANHIPQAARNRGRAVVEFCIDAFQVQVPPAPALSERIDLPGEGAAGDDQDRLRH